MPLLTPYTHIINSKLKHIYLSFDNAGQLLIKSPIVTQYQIEKVLLKKAAWIRRSREKIQNKKGKNLNFSDQNEQNELYFLGEAHPFILSPYEKKRTKLIFNGDTFLLHYGTYDEKIFQKHIDNFYKQEAQAYIPNIVDTWATRMNLKYQKINFRKSKRQWGSCSVHNTLSFNTMMMKLPLNVIEYIIVHELAHIKHKHHQKAFWDLVRQYLPEYKKEVQELKKFTT
jgi:hypothetical protein